MKSSKKVDTDLEITKIVFDNGLKQHQETQEDLKEVRIERDSLKKELSTLQQKHFELYEKYLLTITSKNEPGEGRKTVTLESIVLKAESSHGETDSKV